MPQVNRGDAGTRNALRTGRTEMGPVPLDCGSILEHVLIMAVFKL